MSSSRLRDALEGGATTLETVEVACGAGGDCGACRAEIAALLREREADRMSPKAA